MSRTAALAHATGEENRLLAALPLADYRRLERDFEAVDLTSGQGLYRQNERPGFVFFPRSGVLSLLRVMGDGTEVEVGMVGNEGMAGIGVVLESMHGHVRTLCQVPCEAVRVGADAFLSALGRATSLQTLMHRYSQALMIQFTQEIACNRLHSVEERCATWLLMTHDRVRSDSFELKQEFLALMLGVRRASVTVVAGAFQDAGLITYTRGHVTVLSRRGLKKASCECYGVITTALAEVVRTS